MPHGPDMAGFFPAGVIVESSRGDAPLDVLFPEEAAALGDAVPRRRAEFATVRDCARRALARLGHAPAPILPGPGREPLWPDGVIGSLTHCEGFRGAAVARAGEVVSIGIDAEIHAPLPGDVVRLITAGEEEAMRERLAQEDPAVSWDRLLFSAKESVYKAWYPLMHSWLDFTECEVTIRTDGRFTGRLLVPGPIVSGREVRELSGRWRVRAEHVFTGVWVGR